VSSIPASSAASSSTPPKLSPLGNSTAELAPFLGTAVLSRELSSRTEAQKKAHLVATSPLASDPERWRKRGAKLRAIAAEVADPNLKGRLLRIADGYDLLAERAEQREKARDRANEPDD